MDVGTYDVTSVGGTVSNDGSLRQTKDVPDSTTTSFFHIPTAKYYGVDIYPSGNMGATTVTIAGNQVCPDISYAVKRCFEIDPGMEQTAEITLYFRDAEQNEQVAPEIWHWNGSSWDSQTFDSRDLSGVEDNWVKATGVADYSPFALSDYPTGVRVFGFHGAPTSGGILLTWETAGGYDILGFNLYRSDSGDSRGERLNESLILCLPPSPGFGADCRFLDDTAVPRNRYFYTLEDMDASGFRLTYGPLTLGLWRAYLPLTLR
jgi:hypothetical protein